MKYFLVLILMAGLAPFAHAADAPATAPAPSPFAFKEVNDKTGLQLSENDKPVYVYNYGQILKEGFPEDRRHGSFLHPVYTPDGTVITDDFNKDHPHHRGIFWAWMTITVDGKTDDIWTLRGFQQRFVAWKAQETNADNARLVVENGWFDGDKKFVTEIAEITAHAVKDNQRVLDFTLSFEADDKPVTVVGTPESDGKGGKKGYGGFAMRFAPRDGGTEKTNITADKGPLPQDGILYKTAWAEISGLFNGKPEAGRVDDESTNPGYPTNGWLIRHSFGLLNVSYPGLQPIILEHGKPLVLKYKVTLMSGDAVK